MIYKRKILEDLRKQIERPDITVITGMRRVGKTVVCRMIFDEIESSNKVFLDIENPLEQKIFEETDYNNIWANLEAYGVRRKEKAYIFLDEIQAHPSIVPAIKYLHDHYQTKFFLTGSSSFYLKKLFSESLSGRKIIFEMYPLDFEEFLWFKECKRSFDLDWKMKEAQKNAILYEKTRKWYDEYMTFGGFPQVVLAEGDEYKKQQVTDIFKSYFEKDVQKLADFKQMNHFRDLLLLLLHRAGSKLEITKLSSEVGVSRETVYAYLAFLQGTYFIDLVAPFTRSSDREVSGTKKVYICDNGFLSQLARVDEGHLLENAVFLNLRKYGDLRYYQKRGGREIDFVLMDQKVGIEVKKSASLRDLKSLDAAAGSLKLSESYLVTREFFLDPRMIPVTEV